MGGKWKLIQISIPEASYALLLLGAGQVNIIKQLNMEQ